MAIATVLTNRPATAASDTISTPVATSLPLAGGHDYVIFVTDLTCPYTDCVRDRLRVTDPAGRVVEVRGSGFQGFGLENRTGDLGTEAAVFTAADEGLYKLETDHAIGTLQLGTYPEMSWRYFWLCGLVAFLAGAALLVVGLRRRGGPTR